MNSEMNSSSGINASESRSKKRLKDDSQAAQQHMSPEMVERAHHLML